jgi:hypothetical protein
MAKTLREYGLASCVGDRYAQQWVVQAFASQGITYTHSHRDRSQVYGDALPLFTSGRVRLLDNRKLVAQCAALERRTTSTRDKIDHAPGAHDDVANAAAGALVLSTDRMDDAVYHGPIAFSASDFTSGGYAPHLDALKIGWPEY